MNTDKARARGGERSSSLCARLCLGATVALAAAGSAFAQSEPVQDPSESAPRVLIDRSMSQRPVRLVSISPETVEVTDPDGRVLTLPRSQVLALIPPLTELEQPVIDERILNSNLPDSEKMRPLGRLDLVDGQSLPGTLASAGKPEQDHLTWGSRLFGTLTLSLESVNTAILLPDRPELAKLGATPGEDTVVLVNGDRTEGFVAGIDSTVRVEKSGKTTQLPIARVAAVRFANPPKHGPGVYVWLHDGTVVAASELSVDSSGHCTLVGRVPGLAKQPTATMDANNLRAVCFDASALRPLASCPAAVGESGGAGRRWIAPPKVAEVHAAPLGAADIELPGPMRVEWTLPAGASRVGTIAELPPSARVWGDCEVIVEAVSGSRTAELARAHLSGANPSAEVTAALNGATKVRITIDAGPSGPIQDRVVLRRPMLLVDTGKH